MPSNDVRLSSASLKVLRLFVEEPRKARSGSEITKEAGISSGSLYPILDRLETAGWFTSRWEEIDPSQAGRPRRRYYQITGLGQNKANEALAPYQVTNGALGWGRA
ncbi:helix-turn-helix transcriptional regulator [Mesorhizobium sp. M0478]|uniref:PadR family transcriptional regulator n=1 Tax=Mesorhizobium sp. M0478 TaxID=2956947 RepID=UPI00333C99C4